MEDTVRTHIKGLRQKLRAAGAPANLIETVYRVGYRLNPAMRDASLGASASSETFPETSPATSPDSQATPDAGGRMPCDPADWPGGKRDCETQIWDETSPAGGRAGRTPGPCVLVVTDEPGQIKQIQSLLLEQPFEVVGLSDLTQFWQSLTTHQPDLLIVGDGDRSGPHLCQAVRSLPRWQTIPILVLLPQKTPAALGQVFAAGANDIVTLPLVGPELVARISAYVA